MTTPGRQAARSAAYREVGQRFAGSVAVLVRERIVQIAIDAYDAALAEQPREERGGTSEHDVERDTITPERPANARRAVAQARELDKLHDRGYTGSPEQPRGEEDALTLSRQVDRNAALVGKLRAGLGRIAYGGAWSAHGPSPEQYAAEVLAALNAEENPDA